MGFSTDESLLNGINLDSLLEYQQFMKEIKPILLGDSGYKEVDASKPFGFKNSTQAADVIYNQSGLSAGANEVDAAAKVGMNVKDFRKAKGMVDEYNSLYDPRGGHTDNERRAQIDQEISSFMSSDKTLAKTPERQALEDRYNKLQDSELKRLEEEAQFWESDAGKNLTTQQRDLAKSQADLVGKQLDRQKWAISEDFKPSDVLNKQITNEFNKFKESQARAGNIILGDDPTTAVAKGTAAQQSLGVFQDNMKSAIQRERDSIIQGEGGLSQSGLNLSAGLTAGTLDFGQPGAFITRSPAYNGAGPASPNYAASSSMALAGQQPYQFDKQLQFNYDQLSAARRRGGSGTSGLVGSLAGAGIGGLLAAPTGGMSIPAGMMLGSQFGGAAGLMF